MKTITAFIFCAIATAAMAQDVVKYPWLDRMKSFRERAELLVRELTLEEKAGQFGSLVTEEVKRDGVTILPHYQYWNEAIHGYARMGNATSFPSSKGMSATWDPELMWEVADAISTEARAYHMHKTNQRNNLLKGWRIGLNVWSPTINMAREPRWGREEENYGEDPLLCGVMATEFVKGMQGTPSKSPQGETSYIKIVACAKHFAANNYEEGRHRTSSDISEKMLREYYLPAFEMCVRQGGVKSIMAAYNAVNGIPCSGNKRLLTDILRKEWGFSGYVVSDCAAVSDVYRATKHLYFGSYTTKEGKDMSIDKDALKWKTAYNDATEDEKMMEARATAMCLEAGLNQNCEQYTSSAVLQRALYAALPSASKEATNESASSAIGNDSLPFGGGPGRGAIINSRLADVLETRFALGEFDEPYVNIPWNNVTEQDIESPKHQALALRAAQESITLMKNRKQFLPISSDKKVALIGPYADAIQLGDYSGTPTYTTTPYQAFQKKVGDRVQMLTTSEDSLYMGYLNGKYRQRNLTSINRHATREMIERAVQLAKQVDVVIFLGGTDWSKPDSHETGTEGHDRWSLTLPGNQAELINALYDANPNTVVVLESGSSLDLRNISRVPAILNAWYGGQAQGQAICDAIYGDINPSGHLTSTWYHDISELPDAKESAHGENGMMEYNIDEWGYTYMYYGRATKQQQVGRPQFPFGHGLSYTTFKYLNAFVDATISADEMDYFVKVSVKNTGKRSGADVVQVYADFLGNKNYGNINKRLVGFQRVELAPGETKTVTIPVNKRALSYYSTENQQFQLDAHTIHLQVSTSSADADIQKVVSIRPLAGAVK